MTRDPGRTPRARRSTSIVALREHAHQWVQVIRGGRLLPAHCRVASDSRAPLVLTAHSQAAMVARVLLRGLRAFHRLVRPPTTSAGAIRLLAWRVRRVPPGSYLQGT